jgi:hypothetical protein
MVTVVIVRILMLTSQSKLKTNREIVMPDTGMGFPHLHYAMMSRQLPCPDFHSDPSIMNTRIIYGTAWYVWYTSRLANSHLANRFQEEGTNYGTGCKRRASWFQGD